MANMKSLQAVVEPYIRLRLHTEFGCEFEPDHVTLPLVTGGKHRFDIVSFDRLIVGEIKSNSIREIHSKRKVGVGSIKSVYYDLYLLSLVKADKKLIILTNPGFYQVFSRHAEGKIPSNIELRLIPLPASLESKLSLDRKRARNELRKE